MAVFGFPLGLSVSLCKSTASIQRTIPWQCSLQFVLLSVAADDSELQAGRDGAVCLLVPTCVCTYEVFQHSTQVSWDPSTLLHHEVALVVHKCNCT